MTLDTPNNWAHAQDLERGAPLPEITAASRLASMIGRHIPAHEMSEAAVQMLASKVIAHRHALIPLFAEIDGDPKRLGPKGVQLRQQQTAELSDEDWILERLHEIERERTELYAALHGMGSVYARSLADPDERGADEDDRRISQERADDEARGDAPRLTA